MAGRAPFFILSGLGVCITAITTAAFAGSALGYAVFFGLGFLASLFTAWMITRTTTHPLSLVAGAVLVVAASLAAPVLVLMLIFAIAGAGH